MPFSDSSARPPHSDDALLRRFITGDPAACRTVERWAQQVVSFRPYGIPRDQWDDVIQESLAGLWRACSRTGFALSVGLKPFVRRVVMARCVDWLRRRRPQQELSDSLEDRGPTPPEAAALSAELARVRAAILTLREGCREIIRLHFTEDLPYAEIAVRTGRTEGALRVRMFQCMEQLRRLLGVSESR